MLLPERSEAAMAEERGRRGPPRRKDRLIQTRVSRDLESTLKSEARRRRLTVSHLIRNILEDTFQLVDDVVANVDDIVSESVELARRVGRDARRMADAVRQAVEAERREGAGERDEAEEAGERAPAFGPAGEGDAPAREASDPLAHVYAWNAAVLNRAARCSRCGAEIPRGGAGYVGLSDAPAAPRAWLCPPCREAL
jgi:hypothetical protein